MTYCIGIALKAGLVFCSDSRTNAGVDHVSTFSKMTVFEQPGERVLVVDDGAENREFVALVLEDCGVTVEPAENGLVGLQKATSGGFDAVLMDIQMPRMGGFEATAEIRRGEQGTSRHLPIIAMTAHAMKGDREDCLAAGMDDYMMKPIDVKVLLELLRKYAPASLREGT